MFQSRNKLPPVLEEDQDQWMTFDNFEFDEPKPASSTPPDLGDLCEVDQNLIVFLKKFISEKFPVNNLENDRMKSEVSFLLLANIERQYFASLRCEKVIDGIYNDIYDKLHFRYSSRDIDFLIYNQLVTEVLSLYSKSLDRELSKSKKGDGKFEFLSELGSLLEEISDCFSKVKITSWPQLQFIKTQESEAEYIVQDNMLPNAF